MRLTEKIKTLMILRRTKIRLTMIRMTTITSKLTVTKMIMKTRPIMIRATTIWPPPKAMMVTIKNKVMVNRKTNKMLEKEFILPTCYRAGYNPISEEYCEEK